MISIAVQAGNPIYSMEVEGIRNPRTTEPFYVIAKIYDENGQYYDQFTSYEQKANLLYVLTQGQEFHYSTAT